MRTFEYTYWQDGEFFLGYLNGYPDYETQGYSKEELVENLKDLLSDLESDQVPYMRKVEKFVIA
ncbi:MAG: type II toxin-antitoxin system HicB family antitoxin [Pyrinomonadaceae bacterium]